MSEETGESSRNYYVYAHIAELGMLAFTSFYFYRKCSALEERIAKLESVRITEVQEMDPKSVEALTAHIYAKVMENIAPRPRKAPVSSSSNAVSSSSNASSSVNATSAANASSPSSSSPSSGTCPVTNSVTFADPPDETRHFEEYRGSDRDDLDRELEAEL